MRRLNYIFLGIMMGAVAAMLAYVYLFPAADPSVWGEVAALTGLGPDPAVESVLWRALVRCGVSVGRVSALAAGALALAAFGLVWRPVVFLVSPRDRFRNWWRLLLPTWAVVGSLLAVLSEPVWRLALSGGPQLLPLALLLLDLELFLSTFFTNVFADPYGSSRHAILPRLSLFAAYVLSGLLLVETPLALVPMLVFFWLRPILARWSSEECYRDNPMGFHVYKPVGFAWGWAVTFYLIGLAAGAGAAYVFLPGLTPLAFASRYLALLAGAATPFGWLLFVVLGVVPLVLVIVLLKAVVERADELAPVPSMLQVLAILLALVPAAPLPMLGAWSWLTAAGMTSPLVQGLCAVLSAVALALAFTGFSLQGFYTLPWRHAWRTPMRIGLSFVMFALAAAALLFGERMESRQVRQVIVDAFGEVSREARDVSCIVAGEQTAPGLRMALRRYRRATQVVDAPAAAEMPRLVGELLAATNVTTLAVLGDAKLVAAAGRRAEASGLLAQFGEWSEKERLCGGEAAGEIGDRMAGLIRSGARARECDPAVCAVFDALFGGICAMAELRGDEQRLKAWGDVR